MLYSSTRILLISSLLLPSAASFANNMARVEKDSPLLQMPILEQGAMVDDPSLETELETEQRLQAEEDDYQRSFDDETYISLFPNPMLLGQWLHKQQRPNGEDLTVWLELKPNFDYEYYSYQNAEHVTFDQGRYQMNNQQMRFGNLSHWGEKLDYYLNYNQLYLNGNMYYKTMPKELLGHWASTKLIGNQQNIEQTDFVEIWLYDDFYFNFINRTKSGKSKAVDGIYIVTGDRLVFLYENGEFYTKFRFQDNRLILKSYNIEMQLVTMNP